MINANNLSKTNQIVYNYIYSQIISGAYLLENPVPELEISKLLKVSRSPVREALIVLESQGLVQRVPSRGCFVAGFGMQDINEIFDLRISLECDALQKSFPNISGDNMLQIEQAFSDLSEGDPPEQHFVVSNDLHMLIVNHCGNSRLIEIWQMLNTQLEPFRYQKSRSATHLHAAREEHRMIVEALRNGNLKEAEEKLILHLNCARGRLLTMCMQMR